MRENLEVDHHLSEPPQPRRIRPSLATGEAVWVVVGVTVAVSGFATVLHLADRNVSSELTRWWLTNVCTALGLSVTGGLIASRQPRHPIGWLLLAVAAGQALTVGGREYAVYALAIHHGGWPGGAWGLWLGTWGYILSGLIGIAVLVFPTGHLPSRRWLPVLVAIALSTAIFAFDSAISPDNIRSDHGAIDVANPIGWPGAAHALDWLADTPLSWVLSIGFGLALCAMLVRLRGAAPVLRRQLMVVGLPAGLLCVELIWELRRPEGFQPVSGAVCTVLFSGAVAAAMLRYGRYDLDLVVNRAIVYASVSAVLLGAYLATVALADRVFGHTTLAGSLIAAALVAMLFAPLRQRLQLSADRMLHGERGDPYRVMATLGKGCPSQALPCRHWPRPSPAH